MEMSQASTRRAWLVWVAARAMALALGGLAYALVRNSVYYDTSFYGQWAHGVISGDAIPYRDFHWEYPPAAMPVMVVPGLLAALFVSLDSTRAYDIAYGIFWVLSMLAIDAGVFRYLLRRSTGVVGQPAVRLWLWGLPLLGALSWSRYDLAPAAISMLAVVNAGTGAITRSGVLAGIGGALKIWPLLLAPVQRSSRASLKAAAVGIAVLVGFGLATLALTGETGFAQVLHYQSNRGLQIESIAALPLVWLAHLKAPGYKVTFEFGANQIQGPWAHALVQASSVLYVVGLIALGLVQWRLGRRAYDGSQVALVAVGFILWTLVANKVFSPQYLLWVMAVVAAACVLDPVTWRPYVRWLLAVTLLTQVGFPWRYSDILQDRLLGVFALTLRDMIVIGLLLAVVRRMVREIRKPTMSTLAPNFDSPVPLEPG